MRRQAVKVNKWDQRRVVQRIGLVTVRNGIKFSHKCINRVINSQAKEIISDFFKNRVTQMDLIQKMRDFRETCKNTL